MGTVSTVGTVFALNFDGHGSPFHFPGSVSSVPKPGD